MENVTVGQAVGLTGIIAIAVYFMAWVLFYVPLYKRAKALKMEKEATKFANKAVFSSSSGKDVNRGWDGFIVPNETYQREFTPPKTGIFVKVMGDGTALYSPYYEYLYKTSYMKDFDVARKKIPFKNDPKKPFESSVEQHAKDRLAEWLEEEKSKSVIHAFVVPADHKE